MVQPGKQYSVNSYRYSFNGKEKDKDITLSTIDFESRIFDSRISRFFSKDRFSDKFPSFSPYLYAGNSPISAIDIKGDSLYILFYTIGNKRGDEMFEAAALTRKVDIERSSGFDSKRDKVVVLAVQNVAEIKYKVKEITVEFSPTYGKTAEFGLWSHGAMDGPIGSENTTEDAIAPTQMTIKGWAKIEFNWSQNGENCRAGFYGCRTGVLQTNSEYLYGADVQSKRPIPGSSFVEKLSNENNFKNVTVVGQTSYSFPSKFTNYRENSENGKDNFINTRSCGLDGTKINFQKTYMISGVRRRDDFLLNDQNLVFPMRYAKNGQTISRNFQAGDKKPN
jgi:RHS repeat-associated protein